VATIIDGKKRIPFRRGMLTLYLINRGFAYEEADELANAVRTAIDKQKDISKKEIVKLTKELIDEQYGDRRVGDLVFWEPHPTSISVERKRGSRPFSKELLSHSIQASGLPPDKSYEIARSIESELIDQRRQQITHIELEDLTADLLAEHHNRSYAERYRVWRTWGDLDKPLIIFIGGASGVGKTTIAIALANILDIPRVVATDDIRQIMRLMLSPELMPSIHDSSYAVWSSMPSGATDGRDPVIDGFREQARVVSVGVQAILRRCIEENTSVIIDGVHLLYDFIDFKSYAQSALVIPLCLTLSDRQAYEARFAKRAAQAPERPAHKYLSHLDEILKIQDHIVECSTQMNIPVIDVESVEDPASATVMVVVEQLQEKEEIARLLDEEKKKKKKKKKT
jgi:2-phosphoglycerate kinase